MKHPPDLKRRIQALVDHYLVAYGEINITVSNGKWRCLRITERINADEIGESGKRVLFHLREAGTGWNKGEVSRSCPFKRKRA